MIIFIFVQNQVQGWQGQRGIIQDLREIQIVNYA